MHGKILLFVWLVVEILLMELNGFSLRLHFKCLSFPVKGEKAELVVRIPLPCFKLKRLRYIFKCNLGDKVLWFVSFFGPRVTCSISFHYIYSNSCFIMKVMHVLLGYRVLFTSS